MLLLSEMKLQLYTCMKYFTYFLLLKDSTCDTFEVSKFFPKNNQQKFEFFCSYLEDDKRDIGYFGKRNIL